MNTNDQKLAKFMQAITDYANQQSESIHREVEAFKAERLRQAERDVLEESYVLIQKEQDEMRRTINRERSRREADARRALLEKRQKMAADIFARAREKLIAFTATPDYAAWLAASFREMAEVLPAEGTVYQLAAQDSAHAAALGALCPAGSRIETAEDIAIGGLRGVNTAAGLMIDNTLEARLEQQHGWFTDHSGLTVG